MTNYHLLYKEILKKESGQEIKPTLLLHCCCAPCSSYCLEELVQVFDVTLYFYNPNITSQTEYNLRLKELKKLNELVYDGKLNLISENYDSNEFFNAVKGLENLGEMSKRCYNCYFLRLEKTAKTAKEKGFNYFATTLSISPYKSAKYLNEIGEILSNKYQIKYLYADFKKEGGYYKSIELSKKYELYRQDYCGCVYSKNEREKSKTHWFSMRFVFY